MLIFVVCTLVVNFALHKYFGSPISNKLLVGSESATSPLKEHEKHNNWTNIFEFVPNGLQSCEDLFVRLRARNNKTALFSVDFTKAYQRFLSALRKAPKVTEGFSAKYTEEFIVMYLLAKAPSVRTVCETGFNAGHSTFTWLQSNSEARVYSFDIGTHAYSKSMAKLLQEWFPGRLSIMWGDSTQTLPAFREAHPEVTCDLISIDGGHTHDVCKADYENFKKMANSESIVMLDNYPDKRLGWMISLGDVWEKAKREGEIIEIFQCNYWPGKPHGFSVGRMNVHDING